MSTGNTFTKEWFDTLLRRINAADYSHDKPMVFEDYVIYTIGSKELNHYYSCYHIVGSNINCIFKESCQAEINAYRLLDQVKTTPRLCVPKLKQGFKFYTPSVNIESYYAAIEFISTTPSSGQGNCEQQADGLLSYQSGTSIDAWRAVGNELSRIHRHFWEKELLGELIPKGKTFWTILDEIRADKRINNTPLFASATDSMCRRFEKMPKTLIHFDLLPINVIVKERHFINHTTHIVPQPFFVDWETAQIAPYILDIARITSHCYRNHVIDREELLYSSPYCNEYCQTAIIHDYIRGLEGFVDCEQFQIDYLFGQFFETARMFILMPHPMTIDSYDRFYQHRILNLAKQIRSLVNSEKERSYR